MHMQHYYTQNPQSEEQTLSYRVQVLGREFQFKTNSGVFSKHGLDFGSRLLIETYIRENDSEERKKLLDFGCGYGPVGIIIGSFFSNDKITLADINRRALDAARHNAEQNSCGAVCAILETDGFSNVSSSFDCVLTNPPIRAGKEIVFSIYEGAYRHLNSGGKLHVVIQKKQGAPSSMEKMRTLFGNCEILERKAGYHILCSAKV